MWMTQYIQEIQRQLVEVYNFPADPDHPVRPAGPVPDDTYPMVIDGKTDYVRIENDRIYCRNFGAEELTNG